MGKSICVKSNFPVRNDSVSTFHDRTITGRSIATPSWEKYPRAWAIKRGAESVIGRYPIDKGDLLDRALKIDGKSIPDNPVAAVFKKNRLLLHKG